jgi:hypothetical protein
MKVRESAALLSFSKSSKMAIALADPNASEKTLAEAALKTKPYKENAGFKAAVDAVLAPAPASASKEEKAEAPKAKSSKGGEGR